MDRRSATAKLYLLVFVMCLFIVGMGLYGIHELKKINQYNRTLYADRVFPIEQLTNVRYSYAVTILSSAYQARAHYIPYAEAQQRVAQAERKIEANWNAYMHTYHTAEERQLAQQTGAFISQSQQTIKRLQAILDKGDAAALDELLNTELYPIINPLTAQINKLIDLQINVGGAIYQTSDVGYNSAAKKFYLLILLSLLFVVPFSYFLVSSIKKLIAQLRESNDKIIHSEKKYRNIFENVRDVFCQTALDGTILEISPSITYHTGYTPAELIGGNVSQLYYDPADRTTALAFLNEKGEFKDYELRFKTNDNQLLFISMNASLVLDERGRPDHYDSSWRNITERKKTDLKIRESEQKYRNIFENVLDVFFQTALDGVILDVSPSIKYHTGFDRNELIGTNVADLYYEDIDRDAMITLLKEKGKLKDYEVPLKTKSHLPLLVSMGARLIFDAAGNPDHLDGSFRNITERKKVEQELINYNAELKKTNLELDRFVYSASHDLRAPLKSMLGLIFIIRENVGPGQHEQYERLEMLSNSVVKLDNLIEDILHYSRNNRMDLVLDHIDFEDMIAEIKSTYKLMSGPTETEFKVKITAVKNFVSDKRRLSVILNNFVSNAIKYRDPEKEKPFIKIKITANTKNCTIVVADNGVGIDGKDHEKIFEMFYRATSLSSGSGLGLYIVKETLEKLSGKISVESKLGKGTKFIIEIPNQTALPD